MLFFVPLFFFVLSAFSQNQYPKDYFRSPLAIPLQLSGNFGELRSNHLHSGFDFKTQQKEGFFVFASADGYISRIKISDLGYGKAVYITHPNGYTTVYGHLQSGYGKVEQAIKSAQYKAKSYEIDVKLPPNEVVLHKSDTIALSGNTGGSDGPHLHFEIRDTQSEKIINPMFFGFDTMLPDDKRPLVSGLWVYPLGNQTVVNGSKRPVFVSLTQQDDGSYLAERVIANGAIGFGITSLDFDNVSWNSNGVYRVATYLNGNLTFKYQFDTFAFDETRYVNALIDYERYKTLGQRVQQLFMKQYYPLHIISDVQAQGQITTALNVAQSYRIEIADFAENCTKIYVPISYAAVPVEVAEASVVSNYRVVANRDSMFALENATVSIPAHTFLNDFDLNFSIKNGVLHFHEDTVPAFANFSITFEDSLTAEGERDKLFIGLQHKKKISYFHTKRYKNSFTIYSKTLGDYKLYRDGMPPRVKIDKRIAGKWLSKEAFLQFTISDDLSGIGSYEGYLNGQWVLFEYESKTKKLTHHFADGKVAEGKNDLRLVVTDNVGNSTIFETHFFRSQKP